MKIGLVSAKFINNNISYNIEQIESTLKNDKSGCDLLLFGESFLQGFEGLTWKYESDKDKAVMPTSAAFSRIKQAAKRCQTAVGFGYFELDEEQIFSSYAVIDGEGELIHNFRRLSIGWKEYTITDEHYAEGKAFEVGKLKDKTFFCALCGDLWYDENLKQAEKIACDFVIWPCYIDNSIGDWERIKREYAERVKDVVRPVLFINSLSDDSLSDGPSHGGCLVFNRGCIENELKAGNAGALVFEI